MVNPSASAPVPNAATPDLELAALLTQVTALSKLAVDVTHWSLDLNDKALSKLALDMTRHCIDINDKLPRIVRAQVAAALSELRAALGFYQGIAPTPSQLDALFPPGRGDNQTWYVICIGCQPGLYATPEEADDQVLGVPD
ncbi:hypothetical protein K438DRAFT_1972561 [Mycena galopus ATCC 62051]|nr:hypothetical protein K438DRAFT_1972561 [Mycena galopus ATCC 62051]